MKFNDLGLRVRFAYQLAKYPGDDPSSATGAVRTALSSAGFKVDRAEHMTQETLEGLRADAVLVLDEIFTLQRHEAAALMAKYSHDWDQKRAAVEALRDYFRPHLSRQVDDAALLAKLVTRHYIARRDRGSGWSQPDLAQEFHIGMDRLARAIASIDNHAKVLEHAAMQSLEARLQVHEVAHA